MRPRNLRMMLVYALLSWAVVLAFLWASVMLYRQLTRPEPVVLTPPLEEQVLAMQCEEKHGTTAFARGKKLWVSCYVKGKKIWSVRI